MEAAVKWEIKKDYVEIKKDYVIWPGSCSHITWLDTHHLPSVSGRERWRCKGAVGILSRTPFLHMILCLLWLGAAWLWRKLLNGEGGMKDAWLCHPALLYLSMFSWSRCFVEAPSGPACGKQQHHHLNIASQGSWPQNLASRFQICLSSMKYCGGTEEKKKCPEMWRWVVVLSAWGCYKQPCTHVLYFVARGDSCTEQPLGSAWCELTETSRKSNWLLTSDSNSHSWSSDISSYIHLHSLRCGATQQNIAWLMPSWGRCFL